MFRTPRFLHFTPLLVLIASPLWAADCVTILDNSCLLSATVRSPFSHPVDCQTTFDARCVPPHASTAMSKTETSVTLPPFEESTKSGKANVNRERQTDIY